MISNNPVYGTKINSLTIMDKEIVHNGKRNITNYICECSCGNKVSLRKTDLFRHDGKQVKSCGCERRTHNLVGKTFGFLTVLESVIGYGNWKCQCKCGNTCVRRTNTLLKGDFHSCGCQRYNFLFTARVGDVFGRLTVIERNHNHWLVKCSCGSNKIQLVGTGSLTSEAIKSCGCLSRENTHEYFRNYRVSKGADPNVSLLTKSQIIRSNLKVSGVLYEVRKRDNRTCQLCMAKESRKVALYVHHIVPISIDETKAFDMDNLICLCFDCHYKKAHAGNYRRIDMNIAKQLQEIVYQERQ